MKTMCKCGICGFENAGNAKWQTESKMWEHIKTKHPTDVVKFQETRKRINAEIAALAASIPSLYSTSQRGQETKGSWIW